MMNSNDSFKLTGAAAAEASDGASKGYDLAMRAFQVDAAWYEAHWLTPAAPETHGVLRQIATGMSTGFWAVVNTAANFRRAFDELPSEYAYHRTSFRLDAFPTWLGGRGFHG